MGSSLRGLERSDRAEVLRLVAEAGNFNEAERRVAEEVLDAALGGDADYRFVVADAGGRLAGYATWGRAPLTEATWDLYWVAVDRERRGEGVGRELVTHCEEDVKRSGGRCLLVETSTRRGYEGTIAFYEALGYETVARFRDYYAAGDDKLVFGKFFSF